jgi:hypothetical protein
VTDDRSGSESDPDHDRTEPADSGTDSDEDVSTVAAIRGTDTVDALAQRDDYEERVEASAGGLGRRGRRYQSTSSRQSSRSTAGRWPGTVAPVGRRARRGGPRGEKSIGGIMLSCRSGQPGSMRYLITSAVDVREGSYLSTVLDAHGQETEFFLAPCGATGLYGVR